MHEETPRKVAMISGRIKKLKAKSEINYPHIPEEILATLLSKLPIKSLLRFRCVSKSWESLISDPKFNISSPKERTIVLCKHCTSPHFFDHLINDEASFIKLPITSDTSSGKFGWGWCWRIRGSCNGLVLLSHGLDFFLCNPSTRCCKKMCSDVLLGFDHIIIASGLCYDSSTDDYKVVILCTIWSQERGDDKVMVGSSRNKTWTEVCLPYDGRLVESGPTVNERFHFLVTKSTCSLRDTTFMILGIDPQTNEFVEVPTPEGKEGKFALGLGVLDGCLCLALRTGLRNLNENEIEVLVMKKYGDQASWISLFIRSNVKGLSSWVPLHFMKNAVVLMQPNTSLIRRICAYNGESNLCREIIVERNDCFYDRNVATFVESLVSPLCYNWEEEEHTNFSLRVDEEVEA